MTDDRAVWLYAVVPATHSPETAALTGVAGESVRVIRGDEDISAVAGSVPLSDFAEEPLRNHLEDLTWLENAARAHHEVIDAVGSTGDVVPLRFATIYNDEAAVRAVLKERDADFRSALERVAGRTEWGVKAYVDPEALPETPGEAGAAQDNPGTAYLLRRKAQRQGRQDAQRHALERAEEIRATLNEVASRCVRHPPQDARLAGYQGWMILNDSYLVEDPRAQEFADLVHSCEARFPEVRLELSGPWPAYSFTGDEEGGEQ
ncbi:GvpL/GvpF family gas vesicle protein [Streptomyces silvisoli]|uniref:GvpL/GvpF family gas vesicle protein n=1 Tax=Streptomyces silvisoli TaxID=3034235 RepID=A0ABT5ZTG8_9ACTN|nr:GvpL/GvpF family gas vesicle protein [Streptomyces silvisoli]MDF3293021.1 GvpL/GvpF family gas vesicle protein [Streptomyces silvisoli]